MRENCHFWVNLTITLGTFILDVGAFLMDFVLCHPQLYPFYNDN